MTGENAYKQPGGMEEKAINEHGRRGIMFNDEQYKQILGLLSKDANTSSTQQAQQCHDHQGNMTGMTACFMSQIAVGEWIVDSGATHHVTTDIKRLKEIIQTVGKAEDKVQLPTGHKAHTTATDTYNKQT